MRQENVTAPIVPSVKPKRSRTGAEHLNGTCCRDTTGTGQWTAEQQGLEMGSAFAKCCMQFFCCCCVPDEEDDDEKEPLLPMRDTRREVRDKWKTILENLGFMAEADSLLNVSAGASQDRMRDAPAARAMLNMLHTETSIFNSSKEPPPERYLFILDRLIYLDIAEDFVAKAKRFYPPKDSDDSDEDPTGLGINLPLLLARMNGAPDDDDASDASDASDRS
ncbi:hypothetical protein WMY93_003426 [Mugilogobius chulae]|uniref:Melanoregulin n=1 Tax=Mugilogobius chulae TaxID=88201 RepID=A0AAW0Q4V9_9GOBI